MNILRLCHTVSPLFVDLILSYYERQHHRSILYRLSQAMNGRDCSVIFTDTSFNYSPRLHCLLCFASFVSLLSKSARPPLLYLPVSLHQRTDLKCLFRYGMRASSASEKLARPREPSDMIVSVCQQMRAARSAGGQIMSGIVQHRALFSY